MSTEPGQPYAPVTPFPPGPNGCGCAACWEPDPRHGALGPLMRVMHVCADCGNKRCPRATHHAHYCTGSNEPGQEGSAYGLIDRYPLTAEKDAEEQAFRRMVERDPRRSAVRTDKPQQWRCLEPQCPSGGEWQPATDAAAAWVEHYRTVHAADRLDVAVDLRSAP